MHDTVQLSVPLLAILFGVQLAVPLLAILAGILLNRADINRIDSKLDTMQRDLREFYAVQQ